MSLTRTRLRVAVRVMRYYNSVPLTGAMPVMAPFRGCANHQFTGGYDCSGKPPAKPEAPKKLKRSVEKAETTNKQYTRN